MFFVFILFFFQAEDGIRDGHVTGVQTCALPISIRVFSSPTMDPDTMVGLENTRIVEVVAVHVQDIRFAVAVEITHGERSEERRVGKECRSEGVGKLVREKAEAELRMAMS